MFIPHKRENICRPVPFRSRFNSGNTNMLETGRTVSSEAEREPANVAQPCGPTPKRIVWRGDEIAKRKNRSTLFSRA